MSKKMNRWWRGKKDPAHTLRGFVWEFLFCGFRIWFNLAGKYPQVLGWVLDCGCWILDEGSRIQSTAFQHLQQSVN